MKMKSLATCSPMLLCLVAGAARADLEPFSFGASELLQHQSNVFHSDVNRKGDWLSTTELQAAVEETISRERLLAGAKVDMNRYADLRSRDSIGYSANGELDWSTVGDLSGAFGADSRRHQYLYGLEGDRASSSRNLQTDNHAFARVQLGGAARWSIFAGADASQRRFSDPQFDLNEIKQWSASGGTSYQTSPDLSFGLHGRYTRGTYPHILLGGSEEAFSTRSAGVNTRLNATGNSSFDANIGYTDQQTDGQSAQHFINGGLNWRWMPPSHFVFTLGVLRDSNNSSGQEATIVNANNSVNSRSVNTSGHLDITYELTAKVSLDLLTQYIHRKYSDALVPSGFSSGGSPVLVPVSGSANTTRITLSAHYTPTRTTTVTCGFAREFHGADESTRLIAGPYTDNTTMCSAAIEFK